MKKVFLLLMIVAISAFALEACTNKAENTSQTQAKQEESTKKEEPVKKEESKFKTEEKKLAAGTVVINKFKDYSIHTYTSPDDGALASTQIIETKNKLIVIDAQFILPYAKEAREYINSLNKPIDRLIISHSHPDHWFGSELFKDVNIYAVKEVKGAIEQLGDFFIENNKVLNNSAPLVPVKKTVPNNVLDEGSLTIDGLDMVVKKVVGTEDSLVTMIEIPKDKVLIAQDIVYSNSHVYVAQKDSEKDNWIKVLNELKNNNYALVLGGHGAPATNDVFASMVQYIKDTNEGIKQSSSQDKNNQEKAKVYKQYMISKYPSYKGQVLIDLTTKYLFPEK